MEMTSLCPKPAASTILLTGERASSFYSQWRGLKHVYEPLQSGKIKIKSKHESASIPSPHIPLFLMDLLNMHAKCMNVLRLIARAHLAENNSSHLTSSQLSEITAKLE